MLRNKFFINRGYSLAAWVAVFSVIVAAMLLVRVPIKKALQAKTIQVTDYMFWSKWKHDDGTRWQPQQYKGDDTSFVKTSSGQILNTKQREREGYIHNDADAVTSENTATSGVEEGSQAVLKVIDLNTIVP